MYKVNSYHALNTHQFYYYGLHCVYDQNDISRHFQFSHII